MGLAIVGLLSAIGALLGYKFLSGSGGGGHNHHDKNAGMYHHHFGRPYQQQQDTNAGPGYSGSMKFHKDDSCLPCSAKNRGL